MAAAQIAEPFDLIRVSLSERVFVKLRGDRELRGVLHVRPRSLSLSRALCSTVHRTDSHCTPSRLTTAT